jgi:hypothetical protein
VSKQLRVLLPNLGHGEFEIVGHPLEEAGVLPLAPADSNSLE